jgi:glycosyltransferase involved in cell wall biosynthesis
MEEGGSLEMGESSFDKEYFEYYGGVGPYSREKFYAFNESIAEQIIKRIAPQKVLDVGCAKGFLVGALRKHGVKAYGIDVSAYAIEEVQPEIREYCSIGIATEPLGDHYDLITCIELLEHLPEDEAKKAVKNICSHARSVLVSSTSNYLHPDDTHINLHPPEYWIELFRHNGFDIDRGFDATFISPDAMKFDKKTLRITFLLPFSAQVCGGVRVILEYCHRLAILGHKVNFVPFAESSKVDWFQLSPSVNIIGTNEDRYIEDLPDADILVATLSISAPLVLYAPPEKGEKYYLVQAYEPAQYPQMRALYTYWLPLKKFTVSTWVKETIEEVTREKVELILSGINFEQFYPAPEIRKRYSLDDVRVGMMHSSIEHKGTPDGMESLRLVKQKHPEVKVVLMGSEPKPNNLLCDDYWYNPPQEKIHEFYNSCDIFISPSLLEGFGLPALEAMACAVPAVCTDQKGNSDYAIHGETALVSPIRRPDLLSKNILRLIEDKNLREILRTKGYQKSLEFTWERAVENLMAYFLRTHKIKNWSDEVLLNLTKQLESIERDYRNAVREKQEIEKQFIALKRSWSWKLTGPIRKALNIVWRIKNV